MEQSRNSSSQAPDNFQGQYFHTLMSVFTKLDFYLSSEYFIPREILPQKFLLPRETKRRKCFKNDERVLKYEILHQCRDKIKLISIQTDGCRHMYRMEKRSAPGIRCLWQSVFLEFASLFSILLKPNPIWII